MNKEQLAYNLNLGSVVIGPALAVIATAESVNILIRGTVNNIGGGEVHKAWAIAPFIVAGCATIGSYIAVDELLKHHLSR